MRLSFTWKYGVVLGLGLLAFVGLGVLLYENVAPVINAVEARRSAEDILTHCERVLSGLRDIETGEREYVLSGQPHYRDSCQAAAGKIQQETAALKTLTVNYPDQQRRFALLEFQIVQRLAYSHQLIDALEEQGQTSAENTVQAGADGEIAENIRKTVLDMQNAQNELIKQQDGLVKPQIRTSVMLVVVSYLFAIILCLLFAAAALREYRMRRRAEETRRRLSLSVEQATDLVVVTDRMGIIDYVNKAVEETTGYTAAELLGRNRDLWHSGKHDAKFFEEMSETVLSGGTFHGTVIYRKKNGDLFYLSETLTPLRDNAGSITHIVSTGRDITSQKSLEDRVDYLAYFDALTGVPNRALLADRLEQGIARARRASLHMAVLAVDIDRFKLVNDVFGFDAGDELLKVITARLSALVGEGDTVARVGNDEFVVVLHNIAQPPDVVATVNRIMTSISRPIILRGEEIVLSLAVGITLFPEDGADADTLIQNAHIALGKAKTQGKNNFQFYTPGIMKKASEILVMEKRLSSALKKEEYRVYYQPYVDMTTKRVGGAEALIKWKSDKHGLVSPAKFIPLLEDSGMIVDVGEWVLRTACRQIKEWDRGKSMFPVAVNLSSLQFRNKYLVEMVENTIKEAGVDPGSLTLEVTEGIFMHDLDYTSEVLERLKGLGVSISVDDFGTGYSSLSYLKRLPVDNVKIDMSFVKDITTDPDAASLVMAITSLARSLNLKTIAEGVETEEQWKILRLLRCDMGQGFYFSPALSPKEFEKLLT
jgi:diguanylate cyclase (GGDEF)-like protein/PAS domain S-box-containing protein